MLIKFILRACDYLFAFRPLLLLPAWSFFLLGARESLKTRTLGLSNEHPLFPPLTAFLALTAILIMAHLINQIFDKETDRINKKVFFLSEGLFSTRAFLFMAIVFFLIASFLFHRVLPHQNPPLIAALVLSLVYSLPPLRFCSRPFFDLFSNAAGYGCIAFILGYAGYNSSLDRAFTLSIPYILFVGGTFLYTTLLDMEGDKQTGKISTAVLLGPRASEALAFILIALAVTTSIIVRNSYATIIVSAAFPLCIYTLLSHKRMTRSLFIQAATIITALGAAAAWPLFLVIIAPLLLSSRYYYARRFGISYPGVSKSA